MPHRSAQPKIQVPPAQPAEPKYRKKIVKGHVYGVVTLGRRDIYTGRYNSPESMERYHKLLAEWHLDNRKPAAEPRTDATSAPAPLSVNEVLLGFIDDCQRRFAARRRAKSNMSRVLNALRAVREVFGHGSAEKFGPLALSKVRQRWIDEGRCGRKMINDRLMIVRAAFGWAANLELIAASTWHSLKNIKALKAGEAPIREPRKVLGVPQVYVNAALPYMRPAVATMVRLQLLTGARAGEITILRTADLDMSGPTWTFKPLWHKSDLKGCERTIFFGPQAQQILRKWLRPKLTEFCFRPDESERQRDAERRQIRKTPLYPSHVRALQRRRKRHPKRAPRDRYDTQGYRTAVQRACDKADRLARQNAGQPPCSACKGRGAIKLVEPDRKPQWHPCRTCDGSGRIGERLIPRWGTHQLRHAFAERVKREYPLEVCRVLLGHSMSNISVTERYAPIDTAQASAVIAKMG